MITHQPLPHSPETGRQQVALRSVRGDRVATVTTGKATRKPARRYLPRLLPVEYARFRPHVLGFLERVIPARPSVILDPMAGTAPLLPFVQTHGHTGYFADLLPVHYYANRLRSYDSCRLYRQLGREKIIDMVLRSSGRLRSVAERQRISADWFDRETLSALVSTWRNLEQHIEPIRGMLQACVLFSARDLSTYSKTKNGTWPRPGGIAPATPLRTVLERALFRPENRPVDGLEPYYGVTYGNLQPGPLGKVRVVQADAARLRIPRPVDLIITSPAYCNRLDYQRMYGPELSFLAAVGSAFDSAAVLGTNIVRDYTRFESDFGYATTRSRSVARFLSTVEERQRSSERSSNYYVRCFTRYFARLFTTFEHLLENLAPNGRLVVVTQDNSHRGELIRIDAALRDLLRRNGFRIDLARQWSVHHLGKRNVSRHYPAITHLQTERVLVAHR